MRKYIFILLFSLIRFSASSQKIDFKDIYEHFYSEIGYMATQKMDKRNYVYIEISNKYVDLSSLYKYPWIINLLDSTLDSASMKSILKSEDSTMKILDFAYYKLIKDTIIFKIDQLVGSTSKYIESIDNPRILALGFIPNGKLYCYYDKKKLKWEFISK